MSVLSQTTFQKSFDFCDDAVGIATCETKNGYFILSSSAFKGCISLMILDSLGNIKNSNELDFLPDYKISTWDNTLVQDVDGNLVVFGIAKDSVFWDSHLMKISVETLDTIWTKRVRTNGKQEQALAVKEYQGGYLALAESRTPIWTSDSSLFWKEVDMHFLHFDKNGVLLKEQIIADTFSYSYPGNFVVLDYGNLAVVHNSSDEFLHQDGFVSYIDSVFNIKRTIKIDVNRNSITPTILKSKDNQRLYVSSKTRTYFPDIRWQNSARIFCYDLNGNTIWNQDFFTGFFEVYYGDVAKNNDLLITGHDKRSSQTNQDLGRIARIDSLGNTRWDRLYKIPNHIVNFSYLHNAIETKDGGILAVGPILNPDTVNGGTQPDIYVLKLDANGCLKPTCDSIIFPFPYISPPTTNVSDNFNLNKINIFPNPMFEQLTISVEDNSLSRLNIKIFNSFGQVVFFEDDFQNNTPLNVSRLKTGVYYYSISLDSMIMKSGVLLKME